MKNILISLHCPDCGEKIHEDDRVCPHCGTDLDAPLGPGEIQPIINRYLEKAQYALDSGRNIESALLNSEKALEYAPESAEAHNLHGLALAVLGRKDEAILAFQEALRLNPDYTDAMENLQSVEAEIQGIQPTDITQRFQQEKKDWFRNTKVLIILTSILFIIGSYFIGATAVNNWSRLWFNKTIIIYEPDLSKISSVTNTDLERAAQVLTQRWKSLGYPDVTLKVSNDGKITGRIPKSINAETINSTKSIGLIEFVDFSSTYFSAGTIVRTDLEGSYIPQVEGKIWHTIMTGNEIDTVNLSTNQTNDYVINFSLTETGKQILADYSGQNIGSYLGIVLDKKVIACPSINSQIPNGKGIIQGSFTLEAASALTSYLQTLPLPIPFK